MQYSNSGPGQSVCDTLLKCLADEQAALEELLFKLKEQYFVLSSGEHRWLGRTSAEVAEALNAVAAASALRENAAGSVHIELGLGADANLARVAEHVSDEATCQRI